MKHSEYKANQEGFTFGKQANRKPINTTKGFKHVKVTTIMKAGLYIGLVMLFIEYVLNV